MHKYHEHSRLCQTHGYFSGIGLEIALAFLRKGEQVVLTSRSIDVESAARSREELVQYVGSKQAILLQKDVTKVPCLPSRSRHRKKGKRQPACVDPVKLGLIAPQRVRHSTALS